MCCGKFVTTLFFQTQHIIFAKKYSVADMALWQKKIRWQIHATIESDVTITNI